MPAKPASLKASALRWLAQREHSRTELRAKLLRLVARRAALRRPAFRPASVSALRSATRAATRAATRLAAPDAAPVTAPDTGPDATPGASPDQAAAESAEPADPAAEVELLLQWLESGGHLSQARFIESRVHARQSRFGNLRIRQELKQHGLSLDETTRQALQETELQRAQAVWRKKFKLPAPDAAARLRQMRFLIGRGFSSDVVRRVLRAAVDDDEAGE